MIDTVCLTLKESDFIIIDHNRFSPCTENLFRPPYIKVTGRQPFKSVNNPTTRDKEEHGYLPRITLFKSLRQGGFKIFLHVEFSVPKLLYGNNFDEVVESDFGEVCWMLKRKLELMGIRTIDIQTLMYADVSAIHYGKNIILADYSTPYMYLTEFAKINVNRHMDVNKTDFRNEGHAVKYHSDSFEVILYDKLKDLEQAKKSEKRSVEKDNYSQMSIFDLQEMKKPFEVLRIEVRIGNRKKIQALLQKHKFEDRKRIFNDLFSTAFAKAILIATVEEIIVKYPRVLMIEEKSFEKLLVNLQMNNPDLNLQKLLAVIGAKALLEEMGVRKFRARIDGFGSMAWYRLNKELQGLMLGPEKNVFEYLLSDLERFEHVLLEKYKN